MSVMAPRPKRPRTSPLYVFRTGKQWTQEEMAKELGIHRVTLARLEAMPKLPKRYQRALDDIRAKNP